MRYEYEAHAKSHVRYEHVRYEHVLYEHVRYDYEPRTKKHARYEYKPCAKKHAHYEYEPRYKYGPTAVIMAHTRHWDEIRGAVKKRLK